MSHIMTAYQSLWQTQSVSWVYVLHNPDVCLRIIFFYHWGTTSFIISMYRLPSSPYTDQYRVVPYFYFHFCNFVSTKRKYNITNWKLWIRIWLFVCLFFSCWSCCTKLNINNTRQGADFANIAESMQKHALKSYIASLLFGSHLNI